MAAISPSSTLAEIMFAAKVRFQTTSSCFPPRAWAEMAGPWPPAGSQAGPVLDRRLIFGNVLNAKFGNGRGIL